MILKLLFLVLFHFAFSHLLILFAFLLGEIFPALGNGRSNGLKFRCTVLAFDTFQSFLHITSVVFRSFTVLNDLAKAFPLTAKEKVVGTEGTAWGMLGLFGSTSTTLLGGCVG